MSKGLVPAALSICLITAAMSATTAAAEDQPLAKGTTLEITFSSVDPAVGKIWVGVCTQAQMKQRYRDEDVRCAAERWLDAAEGVTVSFDTLAPGTYAITAFHDEDGNNQLDFDTRGIPFEATGNGNNVKGRYGPPTFDAMKFTLPVASAAQEPMRFTVNLYRVGE